MSKIQTSPAWEDLTFANNFLFCKIMESEPDLCRQILEILLGFKIEKLEPVLAERTMIETLDSKSVRFDVYAKDDKRIFDIEIQTTASTNLPKRARYYQSVIDMDNLSQGENYSRLKDSYVIFLCLTSPFRKKRPVYFFENICRDDFEIKLNDRAFKVFYIASEYAKMESDEGKSFLKFLAGQRKQYMTWQQTIDEEKDIAFAEGLEEGKSEKAVEDAENLLRMGVVTPEQISQAIGLPLEQVMQIKERIMSEECVTQN